METIRLMLDTTAISAFFRGHEEINQHVSSADELHVNPIVIGELLAGFGLGKREQKNREILDEFLSSARVQIIEIDAETSERYATIFGHLRRGGNPVPTNDLWIAASAMQYGLKMVTMDRHYLNIPQIITIYCEP
ncbi:MAG: twitching motility protein PilT [Candidatus Solincola sediminis]|nr:MAG: twitching motility protein PilT [Candidatus Solincola sediminis]